MPKETAKPAAEILEPEAPPAPEGFPITLEEFCGELSRGHGAPSVELVSAFYADELRRDARQKHAVHFKQAFADFCSRPPRRA